jgi:hypothetical protein
MDERTVAELAAWLTLALNATAGGFAAWRWWQVLPTDAAWPMLRAGQGIAVLQALVAGVLFVAGFKPDDGLYWLYALLPVAIGLIAEQLRLVSAEQVLENRGLPDARAMEALSEPEQHSVVLSIVRRELGVMALAAVVVAFLALRAGLVV